MNFDPPPAPLAVIPRQRIDLTQAAAGGVFVRELRQVFLTGTLRDYAVPDRCNFVGSQLKEFNTTAVDFSRCDFKDNAVIDCEFTNTRFRNLGFALNTVQQCRFEGCKFPDTVIQNCEFYDTEFTGCDFTSLVIKDCTFSRCSFTRCRTSNKLFEMCLVTECSFSKTVLQLQTIEENFGLRESHVDEPLRSDRTDHDHKSLTRDALATRLAEHDQPLARLALHYFLTGDLLEGSEHLDAALDVSYWIRTQSTQGSFSTILSRLCEFLLWLHDRNEIAYLPLVQLHHVTGALAEAVPAGARTRQVEFTAYGAHLSLARQIDPLVVRLGDWARAPQRKLTLLVEGKHSPEFYYSELAEMFTRGNPRIVSLVPHNSPWEMALSFPSSATIGAFVALVMATRTRIELQRAPAAPPPVGSRRKRSQPRRKVAALTIGAGAQTRPLLHLSANLTANLVADFKLSISTKYVGRIRKLVLGVLK